MTGVRWSTSIALVVSAAKMTGHMVLLYRLLKTIADRYELERAIGRGASGEVWEAFDTTTQRRVAIKFLREGRVDVGRNLERFRREGEILTTLDHPSIARAFDFSIEGPQPYLALEFVDGIELSLVLRRYGTKGKLIDLSDVMTWIEHIAGALDYAHAIGVIHRDVKPGNVMLGRDWVKLLDFGVAHLMFESEVERQTTVGRVFGTLLYMSPEQAAGEPVQPAADIFALGAVAFSMLTNRRAWGRDRNNDPLPVHHKVDRELNNLVLVSERIRGAPLPTASRYRDLPRAVDDVLNRVMAKKPEERYATGAEFVAALDMALSQPPRTEIFTRALDMVSLETLPDTAPIVENPMDAPLVEASPIRPVAPFAEWGLVVVVIAALIVVGGAAVLIFEDDPAPRQIPVRHQAATDRPRVAADPAPVIVESDHEETLEPVDDRPLLPSRRAEPRKKRSVSAAPPPVVPPPSRDPLLAMLERARAKPQDPDRLAAIERELIRRARALPDGQMRLSIERCARTGGLALDLPELERCARRLLDSGAK